MRELEVNFQLCITVATGWNGFIYTLKGKGMFGGPEEWTESGPHHTLVLGDGDHVDVKNEVRGLVSGRSSLYGLGC